MGDSFDAGETIITRAKVVLANGVPVVAANCSAVSVFVYDESSDFPTAPVYQLLAAAPAGFFGGTFTDGVLVYNFEHSIAATGTFTRYMGHRFRVRYEITTNSEGILPVEKLCDIRL